MVLVKVAFKQGVSKSVQNHILANLPHVVAQEFRMSFMDVDYESYVIPRQQTERRFSINISVYAPDTTENRKSLVGMSNRLGGKLIQTFPAGFHDFTITVRLALEDSVGVEGVQ